jgi:hypothetical protein
MTRRFKKALIYLPNTTKIYGLDMKIECDKEVDAIYFKLSNISLGEISGRLVTESHKKDGVTLNVDKCKIKGGKQIIYGIEVIGISKLFTNQ